MLSQKFRKVGENCLCVGKGGSVLTETNAGLSTQALQRVTWGVEDMSKNMAKRAALQIFLML